MSMPRRILLLQHQSPLWISNKRFNIIFSQSVDNINYLAVSYISKFSLNVMPIITTVDFSGDKPVSAIFLTAASAT